MLRANNLRKSYKTITALDGFSLEVDATEIVGLIGHNGAGKSTFVSIAAGLLRPDEGTIEKGYGKAQVGVAPQTLGLYPTATVHEHLWLFGRLAGLRGQRLHAAISDVAAELLLGDLLKRKIQELSGGQQRRVQAATALVHRPLLILLDEPTVGADPVTRDAILAAVRRHADSGAAVVYTTHYLPELDGLDATLAIAREGRVVARGSRAELLANLPGSLAATFPDGRELTIPTKDPGAALAQLLAGEATLPERVDLRSPSLDDLYKAIEKR